MTTQGKSLWRRITDWLLFWATVIGVIVFILFVIWFEKVRFVL